MTKHQPFVPNRHRPRPLRGPSSFWMHDPNAVFRELKLEQGNHFLDLGCGPGEYALEAARIVGPQGRVWALDRWSTMIDRLVEEGEAGGLRNIEARTWDISESLPVEDGRIDVCLLATILHAFDIPKKGSRLFREIRRVLKPEGRLAIIECQKEDQPFGPPKNMRLAPRDIEAAIGTYGFETQNLTDLGYTYLIQFSAVRAPAPGLPTG